MRNVVIHTSGATAPDVCCCKTVENASIPQGARSFGSDPHPASEYQTRVKCRCGAAHRRASSPMRIQADARAWQAPFLGPRRRKHVGALHQRTTAVPRTRQRQAYLAKCCVVDSSFALVQTTKVRAARCSVCWCSPPSAWHWSRPTAVSTPAPRTCVTAANIPDLRQLREAAGSDVPRRGRKLRGLERY